MELFIGKNYLIATILKLKKEYHFNESYTSLMECYYIGNKLNDKMLELNLGESIIIGDEIDINFQLNNEIIFVKNDSDIEDIFFKFYTYMSNKVRQILYDSKLILGFLIEYKEQQLEKEQQNLEKLKQKLNENGLLDVDKNKLLIKKEG